MEELARILHRVKGQIGQMPDGQTSTADEEDPTIRVWTETPGECVCGGSDLRVYRFRYPDGREIFRRCPCQEIDARERGLALLRRQSCIPEEYRDARLQTMEIYHPSVHRMRNAAIKYVQQFVDQARDERITFPFLFLSSGQPLESGGAGRSGVGKTHTAAAIANALLDQGINVLFAVVPDMLDDLREGNNSDGIAYYDLMRRLKAVTVLVLDDLGLDRYTPFAEEKLNQLVNHRYNYWLPTICTTKRQLKELPASLADRIRDDRCLFVENTAPDSYRELRGRRLAQNGQPQLRTPESTRR